MKTEKQVEQEVDKTLDSLNGMKRASANPYLYTRIQSRMQNDGGRIWGTITGFLTRPVVAFAAILLIILINLAVFFQNSKDNLPIAQDDEQLFASEYNLSGGGIYDATIDQQQ
jgi:hypothetical protein